MPGKGGFGVGGILTAPPTFPGWLKAWAVRLPLLGTQPAAFVFEFNFCNTWVREITGLQFKLRLKPQLGSSRKEAINNE